MKDFPLWAIPLCTAAGVSLLVGAAYLLFERPRKPAIDMSRLTIDKAPETATPEETLVRMERFNAHADDALRISGGES